MTAQQLKNSILQMAVQGRLVPQDPNDEPASVLLERIRAEKERLIREKKIKREKNPSVIFRGPDNTPYEQIGDTVTPLEVPFEIPESWEWVRLRDIFSLQAGKNIHTSEIKDAPFKGAVPCYGGNGIRGYVDRYNHNGDYHLIGRQGALCGNVNRATGRFYATEHAVCVETFCNTDVGWACLFLEALNLNQYATATAQPGLSVAKINQIVIPVPPLSQQRRIVAKFEELAPKLVLYEKAEIEREKLQSSFPARLKKSILQQAVQGKLVPQDPSDESAEVLLKRIQAEKQRLVREGKIKKDKHESVIFRRDNSHYEIVDGVERCIDEELPFEIPESWAWARFGTVINLLSGTDFAPSQYNNRSKGIPYITGASNLDDYHVIVNRWTETPRIIANRGDILLVCKGSGYGKTIVCDIEQAHIARQIMAIKKSELLDMFFVKFFLISNFDVLKAQGQGVIPGIDRSSVLNLLFPLPPRSEQHRIAEKIRELFSICDQL